MLLQSQASWGGGRRGGSVENGLKGTATPWLQQVVVIPEHDGLSPRAVRQFSGFSREAGNPDLHMKFPEKFVPD